jgi:hypothetical protein
MDIIKSSRHQKIIGDFGESIICNWLSRSGFEVVVVDHTGIDVVAYNPKTDERLGITVKSRTRGRGSENDSVNLLSYQSKNDRQKVLIACKSFACTPWIAVYVETTEGADVYLTSLENYDKKYGKQGKKIDDWKMGPKDRQNYAMDPDVRHIRLSFETLNWSW